MLITSLFLIILIIDYRPNSGQESVSAEQHEKTFVAGTVVGPVLMLGPVCSSHLLRVSFAQSCFVLVINVAVYILLLGDESRVGIVVHTGSCFLLLGSLYSIERSFRISFVMKMKMLRAVKREEEMIRQQKPCGVAVSIPSFTIRVADLMLCTGDP